MLSSSLLFLVVLVLTRITTVDSQLGAAICNTVIPPEVGKCSTCRAGWRPLRTGLFLNMVCTLEGVPFPLGDDESVTIVPTFSGNYYQKNKASTTGVKLALEGTYEGNPVPANLNLDLKATHMAPLNIRDPLQFETCTAKVSGKNCVCTICGDDSGFAFDCSQHNIIESPQIKFPNTSSTCFDLKSLV